MTRTGRRTLLAASAVALVSAAAPVMTAAPKAAANGTRNVERGAYLVHIMGCNHCHTPYKMGPNGPEPDMSRQLSGHPAELAMPKAPSLGDSPWVWIAAGTNTAFAGPWGVSFTANLTPDPETGLGKWSPETFIATMKTGRHEGKGRPVLPPMPIPVYNNFTDADLEAVYAYLRTVKPIKNRVPEPLPPAQKTAGN